MCICKCRPGENDPGILGRRMIRSRRTWERAKFCLSLLGNSHDPGAPYFVSKFNPINEPHIWSFLTLKIKILLVNTKEEPSTMMYCINFIIKSELYDILVTGLLSNQEVLCRVQYNRSTHLKPRMVHQNPPYNPE